MANNDLKTLSEIFNNRIFRIPDYQRGYAWDEEQLDDFWEDLCYLKDGNFHYTGLLTIQKIKREDIEKDGDKHAHFEDDFWMFEKGYNAYYVIDGQQRLTTISILLKVIFDEYNEEKLNYEDKQDYIKKYLYKKSGENKSFIFGYEQNNPSDNYFKTKILDQDVLLAKEIQETLYTCNLQKAKNYFSEKLKSLPKEEIVDIFKKITIQLKFNVYEIDDEFDVFVTFETMNNRGKQLSKLELLKNRLIYLTTILPGENNDNNKLRKEINSVWKTVYEYLGKNKDDPLDENEFLRNHWIMYFGFTKEAEAYSKFLFNTHFTINNVINENIDYDKNNGKIGYHDIEKYITSIHDSIKMRFYISNPSLSEFSYETKEYIKKLNRVGFGPLKPLIMCAMIKCSNKEFSEERLIELLKASEQFSFLVFTLTGRPSNTHRNKIYRIANYLHGGEYKSDKLCSIQGVTNYLISQKDSWNGFDLDKFRTKIESFFKNEKGFYGWYGRYYFLYEYELYLQKCKSESKIIVSWEETQNQNTKNQDSIEHIYPQKADKECWGKKYNQFDEAQRKYLLNSLGNLLLIDKEKNSKLRNECFEYKKKYSGRNGIEMGYFTGSYSEIEVAQYQDWTHKEILARGLKMLQFIEERWGIKIENKKELLFLDFID